jgi:TRAP-type C4-dicarboxylate transport system permease small subunit
MVVVNVAMRYLFNAPMGWVSDMNAIFVPLAIAPGLAVAAARGNLIVVSMFGRRFPNTLRKGLTFLARAATVTVLSIIAWQVFGYADSTLSENRTTMLIGLPIWPVWYAVATSFALAVPLSLAAPQQN